MALGPRWLSVHRPVNHSNRGSKDPLLIMARHLLDDRRAAAAIFRAIGAATMRAPLGWIANGSGETCIMASYDCPEPPSRGAGHITSPNSPHHSPSALAARPSATRDEKTTRCGNFGAIHIRLPILSYPYPCWLESTVILLTLSSHSWSDYAVVRSLPGGLFSESPLPLLSACVCARSCVVASIPYKHPPPPSSQLPLLPISPTLHCLAYSPASSLLITIQLSSNRFHASQLS